MNFKLNIFRSKTDKHLPASNGHAVPDLASLNSVEKALYDTIQLALQNDVDACGDVFEDYIKTGEADLSYRPLMSKLHFDEAQQSQLKAITLVTLAEQPEPSADALNYIAGVLENAKDQAYTPVKALLKTIHKGSTPAELAQNYRAKTQKPPIDTDVPAILASDAIIPFAPAIKEAEEIPADQFVVGKEKEPVLVAGPNEEQPLIISPDEDAVLPVVLEVEGNNTELKTGEETEPVQEEIPVTRHEPAAIEEVVIRGEIAGPLQEEAGTTTEESVVREETIPLQEGSGTVAEEITASQNGIILSEEKTDANKEDVPVWKTQAPAFDANAIRNRDDLDEKIKILFKAIKGTDLESSLIVYDTFYAKNEDGTPKSMDSIPNLDNWKKAMDGLGKFPKDFEPNIAWLRGLVVLDLAEAPNLKHAGAKADRNAAFEQLEEGEFSNVDPAAQLILSAYASRHEVPANKLKARGLLTLASRGHPTAALYMFGNMKDKNPHVIEAVDNAGFLPDNNYNDLQFKFLYSAALNKNPDAMRILNSMINRSGTVGQGKTLSMLNSMGLHDFKKLSLFFKKNVEEYDNNGTSGKPITKSVIISPEINNARTSLAEMLKLPNPEFDAPTAAQRALLKKQADAQEKLDQLAEQKRQLHIQKLEPYIAAVKDRDNLDAEWQNSLFQFLLRMDEPVDKTAAKPEEDSEASLWKEAFAADKWKASDLASLKTIRLVQAALSSDNQNSEQANDYCLKVLFAKDDSVPADKALIELLQGPPGGLPADAKLTIGDFILVKNVARDKRAYSAITHDLEHEGKLGETGLLQALRYHDKEFKEDLEATFTLNEMLEGNDWAAKRIFDAIAEPVFVDETKDETAVPAAESDQSSNNKDDEETLGDHYFNLLQEKGPTAFATLIDNDYVAQQIVLAVHCMRDPEHRPEDAAILELFSDNHALLIGTTVVKQAIFKANATACMLTADAIDFDPVDHPNKAPPYAKEICEAMDKRGLEKNDALSDMLIFTASLSGEPNSCSIMLRSIRYFSTEPNHRFRVELLKEAGFLPQTLTLNGNADTVKDLLKPSFIHKFFYDSYKSFSEPETYEADRYPLGKERMLENLREKAKDVMTEKMSMECS